MIVKLEDIKNIATKQGCGRVLDCRGFEPHRRHCVMSLCKTHLSLLSTGSTQEDQSQYNWKTVDWDVKNQIKQTKQKWPFLS